VTVTQEGVERELTVEEALQLRIYNDAMAGKRPAVSEVMKMIAKREEALRMIAEREKGIADSRQRREWPPYKWENDPRNADTAMCLLGIAAPDISTEEDNPGALLLEPWAAQAALGRRRGSKPLSPRDVDDIERCTRAPETLRWPRRTTS